MTDTTHNAATSHPVDPVTRLTAAERERLTMLAEECAEVVQAVTKILRHGFESWHPDDLRDGRPAEGARSNRDHLTDEICDVLAMVEMMDGDLAIIDAGARDAAFQRKLMFSHYQEVGLG